MTGQAEMDKVYQLPQTTLIGGGETSLALGEIIKRLQVSGLVTSYGFSAFSSISIS